MGTPTGKKILLLSLVHPDYLPPVYAIAQVLRDEGYNIHILTFDSPVPSVINLGKNTVLEAVGRHHNIGLRERIKIRRLYTKRAAALVNEQPVAIISFCAFTMLCGIKIKKEVPLIYHTLELSDFIWSSLRRSPLSQLNNLLAIKRISKANLLCTPSSQRSAWQAGRCKLQSMPYTVQNTVYLPSEPESRHSDVFARLVPMATESSKIVLYMGSVNKQNCVLELVQAFCNVDATNSLLIVAGMKDTPYCDEIKRFAANAGPVGSRIVFFSFVAGIEKIALQANADIGVCLSMERQEDVESMMTAPNKVGEYLAKGLYLLSSATEYMRPFGMKGIASLAQQPTESDISAALKHALIAVENKGMKDTISAFVKHNYCMQHQAKPIIEFIKGSTM